MLSLFIELAQIVKKEVIMCQIALKTKDNYVKTDRLGYLRFGITIFTLDKLRKLQIHQKSTWRYKLPHNLLIYYTMADGWLCWRVFLFTTLISGKSKLFKSNLCYTLLLARSMSSKILNKIMISLCA